jgi:predicted Zn-dependent protease
MDRIEQLERILAQEPDDPVALFALGRALLAADRFAEAAERLGRLVGLDPDYTAAYVPLAQALHRAGRAAEASQTCERGIAVGRRTGDLEPVRQLETLLARIRFEARGPRPPRPS